eukprot:CAMPEP_0201122990 /NCGR_PEP_ID=MMETSP0850-20130426/6484_1 /ASSEMBLY_ACC=CAM_ASM_000622 /TAXON_ID=183588 /ORGANISM="Pseudo-nitzschia fraudulenta, Strain WWA7" /LENGTH=31 /DNA_ID= /DNA_START= /DNA_END= /DNA_ORIENTATION=
MGTAQFTLMLTPKNGTNLGARVNGFQHGSTV